MPNITENNLGRFRTLILCFACIIAMPILAIFMILQCLFGSELRALRMAVDIDQCANSLTGGSEDETISSRSWIALQNGRPWAKTAVTLIDSLFGKGHCEKSAGY